MHFRYCASIRADRGQEDLHVETRTAIPARAAGLLETATSEEFSVSRKQQTDRAEAWLREILHRWRKQLIARRTITKIVAESFAAHVGASATIVLPADVTFHPD